jgi:hypothetical protein
MNVLCGLGARRVSFSQRRRELGSFAGALAGELSRERTVRTRGRRIGLALGELL